MDVYIVCIFLTSIFAAVFIRLVFKENVEPCFEREYYESSDNEDDDEIEIEEVEEEEEEVEEDNFSISSGSIDA